MHLLLKLAPLAALCLSACNSTLNSRLDGNVNAKLEPLVMSLELKGPITMQLQAPTVKYEGTYISKELIDRVDLNKTGIDWVLAVLGEPDKRAPLNDGTEIWKWSYHPVEQSAGVFSVFGGSKDEPKLLPVTAFLRIRQGIVVEKWRD